MNGDRPTIQMKGVKVIQLILRTLHQRQSELGRGFTLLEAVFTVVLIGILAAIAAPAWQAYLNTQRLNAARSQTVSVLTQAQTRAKQQRITYEVGFRQRGQQAQWAIYPAGDNPATQSWQNLPDGVQLLETETTMTKRNDFYRVQFNHEGAANGRLGRVTFAATSGGGAKRCVFVSNLLGVIREGENRPNRRDNPCE